MTGASTSEFPHATTYPPDDAVATMALSWAEILIVTYFRGGNVTAEQLEQAIAMAKAGAKLGSS